MRSDNEVEEEEEEEPDLMAQIEECKIREANDPLKRGWTYRADFEELLSAKEEDSIKKKISNDMSSSTASLERRSDAAP